MQMHLITLWASYCGRLTNNKSMDAHCVYDDSAVRDDRVDLDCDDMSQIEIMGHSFSVSESRDWDGFQRDVLVCWCYEIVQHLFN